MTVRAATPRVGFSVEELCGSILLSLTVVIGCKPSQEAVDSARASRGST